MASILTAGSRTTITPEGRKIVQIPVSTTGVDEAASAPTAPSGTRLVSYEYTIRADGGRDYNFIFESNGSTPGDSQIQINGTAAQEPIETHPKFNGQEGFGTVNDADLAAIRKALSDGGTPVFTGTGINKTAAENLYSLMLKGVTHYYTPSGITYSETFDETTKPDLNELCTVDRPPTDAPRIPSGSNWLLIGVRSNKVYSPDTGTSFWRVTREWLASGPRGWNADFEIYT
jgi:hypothetical protein